MVSLGKLKSRRERLFNQCVAVDSLADLLKVQLAIAKAIRGTEVLLAGDRVNKSLRFDIERLRLYADGLAWLFLHPHVIRQMAKNADVPKSLVNQGDAFDMVLASAREYFERLRVPVLISDITNILKIGDLVLVFSAEKPTIVEVKKRLPEADHLMQGRSGRQLSRAMSTMEYLHEGNAKLYGDDTHMYTIECKYKSARNWSTVEAACLEALRTGVSRVELSGNEVVLAYARGREEVVKSEAKKWNRDSTVSLGTTLGVMNMRDGLFPPPVVWPISPRVRFALLEEDIVLMHLVDWSALECVRPNGDNIHMDSGTTPVHVVSGGNEYPLTLRFLYDVVYGFETALSCQEGLFEFARQIAKFPKDEIGIEYERRKPVVHSIDSVEQARELTNRPMVETRGDMVAIAPDLLETIGGSSRLLDVSFSRSYVIMPVTDFMVAWNKSAFSDDADKPENS